MTIPFAIIVVMNSPVSLTVLSFVFNQQKGDKKMADKNTTEDKTEEPLCTGSVLNGLLSLESFVVELEKQQINAAKQSADSLSSNRDFYYMGVDGTLTMVIDKLQLLLALGSNTWKVTADHPILQRPDKLGMTKGQAEVYVKSLRDFGYENIEMSLVGYQYNNINQQKEKQ